MRANRHEGQCSKNRRMVRLFWGILNTSTPTHAINPSFWHLHNNKISHTLLFSVRYYLVVGRAGGNKVFFILRKAIHPFEGAFCAFFLACVLILVRHSPF